MSIYTSWFYCPACGAEFTVAATLEAMGSDADWGSEYGWLPGDPNEWTTVCPATCEECGGALDVAHFADTAIASGERAMEHARSRRRAS